MLSGSIFIINNKVILLVNEVANRFRYYLMLNVLNLDDFQTAKYLINAIYTPKPGFK